MDTVKSSLVIIMSLLHAFPAVCALVMCWH